MSDAAERASKRRKDLIGVDRLRHVAPRQYSDCGQTPTRSTPRPNEDGSSADSVDHDGEPPPAVNCLTPSFVAEIRCTSTNRLSVHTRGSAEPSVRRRASAAAGSDGDAAVKVSLNEMLAR
jgi:hypothetical protein